MGGFRGGAPTVTIATNNGAMGGGEVMLLLIAEACRRLGVAVQVVAPSHPAGLADAARKGGFRTVVLQAEDRRSYMSALRRWDAERREGWLWCNGLVPALATAGHPDRVVHLHQRPRTRHLPASWLARRGAVATLVPSEDMRAHIPRTRVLENWTRAFPSASHARGDDVPFTIGFLGRTSTDKGVHVLAEAVGMLEAERPGRHRLALAGEPRFVHRQASARVEAALSPLADVTTRRGWIDPVEFFSDLDVLVVPSVQPESFGLVAAEAMATRTPLIVSDAGALPEVVGADHGVIVPRGDPEALASAIAEVRDGVCRPDVQALHDRWTERFSSDAGTRRVRLLLTELGVLPAPRGVSPAAARLSAAAPGGVTPPTDPRPAPVSGVTARRRASA